jgi:alpha-tubulin suppressor-like RCC1 family protein
LGRITATPASPGTVVKQDATNLSPVSEIAAGRSHSLFRLSGGTVWACGYNLVGELGDGTTTDKSHAVQVLNAPGVPLTGASAVSAGLDHSLALVNGEVWAWGLNNYGQLGNGAPLTGSILQTSTVAVQVRTNEAGHPVLSGIDKIVAIGNHNLAVDNTGQLWVWGYNAYGQLGLADKDTTNRNYATRVPGFSVNSGL